MTTQSTKADIADRYGKLPLSFEGNEGQTDREVKFLSRGPGYDLFLTSAGAVLTLRKPPALTEQGSSNKPPEASVLRLKMIGANSQSRVRGEGPLPGKINYLTGDDPDKWHVNIPTYRKVYYTEIYPKVDLVYYGNRTELEYDFVVAPGGDVQAIRFQFEGTDGMMLDDAGDLRLTVKQDEVILRKPLIYQLTDQGDRREVKGEYVIKGKEVRFKAGVFDARKPLIIDPVLSYSTLLGAGGNDYAFGIAVDSSGSAYITGLTGSGNFPTTPGAFQTSSASFGGAFVTKLDPTGTSLVYSTYLSGNSGTTATAIAVDSSGNAYVTGYTSATDFPLVNPIKTKRSFFKTTNGAANWSNNNNLNVDVTALAVAPSAPSTIYAGTLFGPYKSTDGGTTWLMTQTAGLPDVPFVTVLAIDPANPFVVYAGMLNGGLYKTIDGGTSWSSVPVALNGARVSTIVFDPSTPATIYLGSGNGVFKSTDSGSTWTQLNNFGIPGTPNVAALAIDPTNPATIYAGTFASGAFKTTNGGSSWTAINSGLVGSFASYVVALAIDPLNPSVVYAGSGYSDTGGSINKSTNGGGIWAPVNTGVPNFEISALIVDRMNSQIVYAATKGGGVIKTTNGGSGWGLASVGLWKGRVAAMVTDPVNSAILYAGTGGGSLPDDDAFVSELNASGTALLFSTYLGGSSREFGYGIALDASGNVLVAGQTNSTNFPAVNAIKSTLGASDTCGDGFVTKIHLAGPNIVYSTYLGGDGCDTAYGVASDPSGNAYVTGSTGSVNFPVLNAFQPTIGDSFGGDAFVTKLNSNGALVYSTYLGGVGSDVGYGIAVDAPGNAYITGTTGSNNFPLANPVQPTNLGGDAFVTKLNNAGSGLIYSTFLGGSGTDVGRGIAVDSAGNAYVAGFTGSADFPVVAGAIRTKSPIFKSTNGGGNWNNDNYGFKSDIATVLALDPTKPSTIYAGTRSDVFKSTDGGQSWNSSSNGLVRPSVNALVVNQTTPSTIYLAIGFTEFGNSSGVYKSINAGKTWNAANGLTNVSVLSLAIDPVTPSTLYAGVNGSGILKSVDGGVNWTVLASQTLPSIDAIVIDPITPTTVYAGGDNSNGGVFKSTDGGVTWQSTISLDVLGLTIDPATPFTIYASTREGIYKSINGAAGWTVINTSLTGAVTIDPVTSTTLYAISSGFSGGVFKSTDGGNSWAATMNKGLTYPFVSSLIINPNSPAKLYVGVNVYPPDDDAFVVKFNPSGTALVYSTLLGGSASIMGQFNSNDEGFAIAVDSLGNAYVAGASNSTDFPVTPNSFQPFNRGFTDVFVSKLTMSYIISGHVRDGNNAPVSGADVTLSDGASLSSVVTENDGSYQFSHLGEGGNFTVSAAKPHFTMAPASQSFNNLHSNQTVDFIATPTDAPFYSISGHITNNGAALSSVTVALSGSQQGLVTTDGNGLYSFTLTGGGNYTVTPSLLGFTFTPASQTFNNLSADQTANFAAARQNFVVTNVNDHGSGSLRQAIMNANATVGLDMIAFNIPGSGVHTINMLLALPELTDPVVIDATTQPGYSGAPLIELNGAQTNSNSAGFRISAGGSTIRGFIIGGFDWGIFLNGGSGNVIQGNYIGLDATGTVGHNNDTGISIFNSASNLIGGTSSAARNVISGNGSAGVEVAGPGNQVQGNFIGTNASGSAAVPNGINGVDIGGSAQATNNTIGGTAAGAGNLISGNQRGVNCSSSGNVIQGNLIGTNVTGTAAIGNGTGVSSSGPNTVGGTAPGARNIISGNSLGVSISGVQSRVQGNFIGTDITGMVALGNTSGGVDAGGQAVIGGTTPEARNIISGNGGWGNISLGFNVGGGDAVTVQGNYIGTDVTGNVALVNPSFGVIAFRSNNLIGGTAIGAGNVISGNSVGVQIGGSTSANLTGNLVQGNLIGLNATGDAPLPNRSDGVNLDNASNNTIGGDLNAGNKIGFNGRNGVFISSGTGNSIRGNSIFSNVGLGIDLSPIGVTANDSCDTDSGANNRQNRPLLVSALSSAGSTHIQGTLNSMPNTTFNVDFYSSLSCDPSGNGEGEVFLGSITAVTDASCNATITAILPLVVDSGHVITATATDASGNTSEFSLCIPVCSYQLSASSASFSADGGTGTVDVVCTNGCAWAAASNDGWITITSGSSGSGNGSVAYSVAANISGDPRTGTITIAGQTFTVDQSDNPTAVNLESFTATAYDSGVFIEWRTGLEVENLGFYIYREEAGQRTRITPEIIAGSALIAGNKTALTAGNSYGWFDTTVKDRRDPRYLLEDIDLDGKSTLHGPITPRRIAGLPAEQSTAALLSRIGKDEPRISQLASNHIASAGPSQKQFATQWDLSGKPAIKLTIKEAGWYRVTQPELLSAGLDSKTEPRNLQLYLEGEEQPMLVAGEQDGGLDRGDALEFYAYGQDTPSTDAHTYWLVSGKQPGKRIIVARSEAKPGGATSFSYTIERKERTIYFSSLKNGEAENFFGPVISPQPLDQKLALQNLDQASPGDGVLEVALQGVTDLPGLGPDHQVKVTLNGALVGRIVFDGRQHPVERFQLPHSLLKEGENVVTLIAEAGPSDISLVDFIRVTYRHSYTADQNALRMTVGESQQAGSIAQQSQTIDGFTNASIRVVDVTNPSEPQELKGQIAERKGVGFAVTVQVAEGAPRTLMAFTSDHIGHPDSITANQPSNWQDKAHGADLLIITHQTFAGSLAPLTALRQKQGFAVETVDIEDIYDEFSFGEKSPQAIRDFMAFAHARWKLAPRFVMFAGDASFDPKNYLGAGDFDFVPTKLVDTTYLETASDDWFVDFNDDGLPEMYVGRLPIRTSEEAAVLVSKIVSYDSSIGKSPQPQRSVLLVADKNDGFDFEQASSQLRALVPLGTNVQEIFRGRLDDVSAKKQLISSINAGQSIVNYTGHGSTNVWRSLFTTEDARSLTNQQALPLFVTMTCLNGFFQDPVIESLAEGLLKSERGGAVAVWASSALTAPSQQTVMNRQAYRLLFTRTSALTIGEITSKAKASVTDSDIRRTWILFGDPTMRLK